MILNRAGVSETKGRPPFVLAGAALRQDGGHELTEVRGARPDEAGGCEVGGSGLFGPRRHEPEEQAMPAAIANRDCGRGHGERREDLSGDKRVKSRSGSRLKFLSQKNVVEVRIGVSFLTSRRL